MRNKGGRTRTALAAVLASAAIWSGSVGADPFPPVWGGPAVHHQPVAWPTEPPDPAQCGSACGEWKPYTRFQNTLNDPRIKDPSNGGTSPQNYVNIASSCIDKDLPSIYYNLKKVDENDPTRDVIMFRWRVEQIANTYATGPNPGTFGATHPWNSALWTVLFDVDGTGYRDLAAHLNGSSGNPSTPIDMLAGIYGRIPTQSINYLDDPDNIKLLGHNPTAFIDGGTNRILNFQNNLTPTSGWPNGSAETVWDYGTTRAIKVSTRSCTEYFVDYQIPVAMLDATPYGGPKIDRSTPISMLFCTANSLNNPFQKDCALNRAWVADPNKPGPFGDYISFDQEEPYSQPIIRDVKAVAPLSCTPGQTYTLSATVQDTLAVVDGVVRDSLNEVSFWYYHDVNGDGISNDGSQWTFAATGTRVPGTLNKWTANWDSSNAPKGRYLIGVQAVDNRLLVDDDMPPNPVDNRTFSYVTSNAMGHVYIDGNWATGQDGEGNPLDFPASFPDHASPMAPVATENWYGNPSIVGTQVAFAGFEEEQVDLAVNACGVAPSIDKSVSPANVAVSEMVTYTITISNPSNNAPITINQVSDVLPAGFTFGSVTGGSLSGFSSAPSPGAAGELVWVLNTPAALAPGDSATLLFTATAGSNAGVYNNTAAAQIPGFGLIESEPVPVNVDAARLTLSKTPNLYLINPDGTTQLTYTIAWSNDSAVLLTDAQISDVLPSGVTYIGCTGGTACAENAGTVTWQLGNLVGGSSGSVTLTVTINTDYPTASLLNTAAITATPPGGGSIQRSASTTIAVDVPEPAFTLSKTANTTRIAPGASVTWTVAYANFGTGPASNVKIVDDLPAGFSYTSCSATGSHFSACSHSSGVVTFHDGNNGGVTIPSGASGTVTVTATAAAAPFTFPNPAVNNATVTWAGGALEAVSPVGLSGQACEAAYYLRTVDAQGVLDTLPPDTEQSGGSVQTRTGVSVSFTSDPVESTIDLAGKTLSLRFYMQAGSANTTLATLVEAIAPDNSSTVLGTFSTSQALNTAAWYTFTTGTFAGGTTLASGARLRLTFTGDGNNAAQALNIYFGGNVTVSGNPIFANSHASVCSATAPVQLELSKTVDKPLVQSSSEKLTYTLTYSNLGGTTATSVTLTDTLPAGMTNCEASTDGSNWSACNNTTSHVFNLADLSAGASGMVYVRGDSPAGASGSLINVATLDSSETTPVEATATTLVGFGAGSGTPELVITKSADKTAISAGELVTYTLTVVNVGSGPAQNVEVFDTVPATAFFNYVGGSIAGGSSRSVNGDDLSWTVTSLGVGDTVELSYRMVSNTIGVPAGVTLLDNTATVSDDHYCTGAPPPVACTSNEVTVSLSGNPVLGLTKSADPMSGLVPGGEVTWTVTVTNHGSADATNVVISDPIIAGTQFVSVTAPGTFDAVNNRVLLSIPTLLAGEQRQLVFVSRIGALPAGDNQTLTNVARAVASNAPSVEASVQVTASAAPELVVNKSGPASVPFPAARVATAVGATTLLQVESAALIDEGDYLRVGASVVRVLAVNGNQLTLSAPVTAAAGDPVLRGATFALSYRNDGNATATNVTLTDTLPGGWVFAAAGNNPDGTSPSAPSVGSSGSVVWTLGEVQPGQSGTVQVTAIATATGTHTNTATLNDPVVCTGPLPDDCSDTSSTVVGGLAVHKRTSTPVLSVHPDGAIAEYTITLTNTLSMQVNGVTVTDLLPPGFTYRAGSTVSPVGEPSVDDDGVPTWSGLSVPANGTLEITFQAVVSAYTGTATYDNEVLVAAPEGVGVTPFDPLSTTDEDVTVIGAGAFVIDGYVFHDVNQNGGRDPGEAGFDGVRIEINDADQNQPYVVYTDGFGYFRLVLVEQPAIWTVEIKGGENAAILDGYDLLAVHQPMPRSVPLGGDDPDSATVLFGHAASGEIPTFDVIYDANGATDGSVPTDGNSYRAGDPVTVFGNPGSLTRDGYTFVGWNTQADGSGTDYSANDIFQMPSTDVTLYAQWTPVPASLADVYTTVSAPDTAAAGSTVNAMVTFGNQGVETASDVTYVLLLSPGLTDVSCGALTCSYDPGLGRVTIQGLPTALTPGQSMVVDVSYTMPEQGLVGVHGEIATSSVETTLENNSASAQTGLPAAPPGVLQIVKTAYLGNDDGAQCPGSKELVFVNKDLIPVDITWCFIVTNTGTEALDDPRFTDEGLGVTPANQVGMELRSGSFPLQPGETAVWYYEDTRQSSLVNYVSLEMTVVDEHGDPVPDAPPATGEDSVPAIFGYVFDPPFGVKTGELDGQTVVRWTMVWVNDNVVNANGVLITDPPPEGMTMIGSPTCTPYGETTVDLCTFDAPDGEYPRGRVRVLANFGPDFGVTLGTIDTAPNRLEIAFDVLIDDPNVERSYENQGQAEWTPPGEDEPFEAVTYDRTQLEGLDPDLPPSAVDPEQVEPTESVVFAGGGNPPSVTPIPVGGPFGILLLILAMGWMAWRQGALPGRR